MVIIPFFTILPLLGAFIIYLCGRRSKLFTDIFANITTFVLSLLSLVILFLNPFQPILYKVGGWLPPWGITLVVDGLTRFMLITVNFIAWTITLFSVNYMEKFTSKYKFYTLFLFMLAGMNGLLISGDIFNVFVFLEIASVASYALVAYGVEAEELEASFKYLVMSSFASLCILLGIALLYSYTSTLNIADMGAVLSEKGIVPVVIFSAVLFFLGVGLKSAIVPFHAWLPDAHPSAPAPISATLSGVLIKTLGVYLLLRIFYNLLGVSQVFLNILMFLGVLSIMVGVIMAISQMDIKRLLAYHSISQIGYIILGIGLGTPLGILGGLFHLFNHSVFKSLLFLNSGAIEYTIGTRELSKMGGLRKNMPITGGTSLIASLSISGIPPFNGFFSKLLIIIACIQRGYVGYAIWAIIGSILTLSSFMKVQKFAFFGRLNPLYKEVKEVPIFMKTAMVILSIICILSGGMLIPYLNNYLLLPAQKVILGGLDYKNINESISNEK
ncbi:MAG: monovalent cation/H+ antiporter subunit D family protein [Candidatus Omnitrophica bacterium]|nr:monovalent cation/H+ antiporter subunit D family protein [Candidatus Omnitrophota bacterium]